MEEGRKQNRGPLRLRPRLALAMELAGQGAVAADIGCDHGLLSCALLEQGRFSRVIAADISESSLEKCRALANLRGLTDGLSLRVGDGLSCLAPGEADTLFLLGMGGTLIARILEAADPPLMGAKLAVLSPMAGPGIADLREYLYRHGYSIQEDRLVEEEGRLYQLLSVLPPSKDGLEPLPKGWPEDCFELGYRAFEYRVPLFDRALDQRILAHEKRLTSAKGSVGEEIIAKRLEQLNTIKRMLEDVHEAE